MSRNLNRFQAILLGLVVLSSVAVGGAGLVAIANRQGLWAEHVEITAGFVEAHDIAPGTAVRIRGVKAGQVVGVDYPPSDSPGAVVQVRMRLDAQFRDRIYADGAAQIQSVGMLGSKVIAITPGTPQSGVLGEGQPLRTTQPLDLAAAAEKMAAVADEAEKLLKEVRTGQGTLGKLVQDGELYEDLKGLTAEARGVARRADAAAQTVEQEMAGVRGMVSDGRETLRSVKQGTDAMQRLPLVRSYVQDSAELMVRPDCRRESIVYNSDDLFEPGTAILTAAGKSHLQHVVNVLQALPDGRSEVVVAALSDPNDPRQTPASAGTVTRKQSETVVEYLKEAGAHKIGWWSRREITPIGLGQGPSPLVAQEAFPPSYVQVLVFVPQ